MYNIYLQYIQYIIPYVSVYPMTDMPFLREYMHAMTDLINIFVHFPGDRFDCSGRLVPGLMTITTQPF